MPKSQHSNAHARAHTAHMLVGINDSTAALITPNGSIRRTVMMINPLGSMPPPSVTCRAAAPPPRAPTALTDRRSTAGGPKQPYDLSSDLDRLLLECSLYSVSDLIRLTVLTNLVVLVILQQMYFLF